MKEHRIALGWVQQAPLPVDIGNGHFAACLRWDEMEQLRVQATDPGLWLATVDKQAQQDVQNR